MADLAGFGSSNPFKFEEPKLEEAKLREVVKGLWNGADLESAKVYYYPIYEVEVVSKNGGIRTVYVDAASAKEISL
jgi:uncharacterized membrane protein YkoI